MSCDCCKSFQTFWNTENTILLCSCKEVTLETLQTKIRQIFTEPHTYLFYLDHVIVFSLNNRILSKNYKQIKISTAMSNGLLNKYQESC